MALIQVLDSETIDKIAAGEVVERPASVVKELVENAIDAGADAITVEAKDGGITFLRVTDNGSGMEPQQVRTAFLRHATSKIVGADDLNRISSLGFRGEALSSISAVAKVEIVTKTKANLTGIRMVLEGSQETDFAQVGAPDGTTFIVRNLFFNTPVRRKFLKTPATEGGYITELMEHLAMSRPDISFRFILGNQERFHTSGNGDLKEVIYRIYGREIATSLVPLQYEEGGIRIEGYLGKTVIVRSNRNFEIYYMNGRFIKSNVIARAIEEGYKEYLMQHKFPFCVLHINMPPEWVDVNVHPTKMEVRFSDALEFCNILTVAVRDALKIREMIPRATVGASEKNREEKVDSKRSPEIFETRRDSAYKVMEEATYQAVMAPDISVKQTGGTSEKAVKVQDFVQKPAWLEGYKEKRGIDTEKNDGKSSITGNYNRNDVDSELTSDEEDVFFVEEPAVSKESESMGDTTENVEAPVANSAELLQDEALHIEKAEQLNLFEEKILTRENRSRYRIIGQVFDTYWMLQYEEELMIIDQHAAHEKVKYERLMKQYRDKAVLSQRLLPPIIITLSGREETVLKNYEDTFRELGFEIEDFGGNEYALRSVPVDLYGCSEREMFLEVLDELCNDNTRGIRVVEEKIASMSCKAAVKGNHAMSLQEAEQLIDELLTLENPYNCPHGRPTIIKINKTEMEKKFKRIV